MAPSPTTGQFWCQKASVIKRCPAVNDGENTGSLCNTGVIIISEINTSVNINFKNVMLVQKQAMAVKHNRVTSD